MKRCFSFLFAVTHSHPSCDGDGESERVLARERERERENDGPAERGGVSWESPTPPFPFSCIDGKSNLAKE